MRWQPKREPPLDPIRIEYRNIAGQRVKVSIYPMRPARGAWFSDSEYCSNLRGKTERTTNVE